MDKNKWVTFGIGKLISTVAVIAEIATLRVCFDEYIGGNDDDGTRSDDLTEQERIDFATSFTYRFVMFILVFGLLVELLSALALSVIYQSPFDISSAHKIPFEYRRHCGGSVIMYFFGPFSWAIIYVLGGLVSIIHGTYTSCEGHTESGLEIYLAISGILMGVVGLGMFIVSVLILPFACGSPTNCTDRCCTSCRKMVHKRILSKGPYVNGFWKLQGAIWSHRMGGFGLPAAVGVGMGGMFGELLSAVGSVAPEAVEPLS